MSSEQFRAMLDQYHDTRSAYLVSKRLLAQTVMAGVEGYVEFIEEVYHGSGSDLLDGGLGQWLSDIDVDYWRLEFSHVTDGKVVLTGHHLNHGEHTVHVPLEWFTDRDGFVARHRAIREEHDALEEQRRAAAQTAADQRERAEYERLRAKFEGEH